MDRLAFSAKHRVTPFSARAAFRLDLAKTKVSRPVYASIHAILQRTLTAVPSTSAALCLFDMGRFGGNAQMYRSAGHTHVTLCTRDMSRSRVSDQIRAQDRRQGRQSLVRRRPDFISKDWCTRMRINQRTNNACIDSNGSVPILAGIDGFPYTHDGQDRSYVELTRLCVSVQ